MKKYLIIPLLALFMLTLYACSDEETPQNRVQILNFYYLNDLHGALLEGHSEMGMARIGTFLIDEATNQQDSTIILGGGDMVQGTLASNAFYGENTVKVMDEVSFDATVIGNHEFDWGLKTVTRYYDDTRDAPYQAQHPLLGANVFYDNTTEIPSGIEPYVMINRQGLKIGIIGTMEAGLESSILASEIEGYYFADPVPIIEDLSKTLRSAYDADIVVVISHDRGETLNVPLANFDEASRIDAVFNGHSHQVEASKINHMPTLISGSSGSHVGHVQIQVVDGVVHNATSRNLGPQSDARFNTPSRHIESVIESYHEAISPLYEPDLTAKGFQSQRDLTQWMSQLMMDATNADFGFQNTGGTRDTFQDKEPVSLARLYDVFPFDNTVVTVSVEGREVQSLMNGNPNYATRIDMDTFDLNETYKIATNNYVFYHPFNALQEGQDITYKSLDLFDLAVHAYQQMIDLGDQFDTQMPFNIEYYDQWTTNDGVHATP